MSTCQCKGMVALSMECTRSGDEERRIPGIGAKLKLSANGWKAPEPCGASLVDVLIRAKPSCSHSSFLG